MEVLLKEAQQEVALLRTDLFNTRRLAEERRQAVDALQSERERLSKHCDAVESTLRAANAQLNHVPELQQRCAHLEACLRKLQSEMETAHAARRILEQELDDERRQRAAVAEQKALLEGDRARLAKQRDDLAAQLRVEQKKAREAEEEQVRAEEDAATLRSELTALQQAATAAATAAPTPSSSGPASGPASLGGLAASADTAAAIAASVAAATTPLLEQLEHERNRAAMLLSNLHAAKSEIMELSNRLCEYEARHTESLSHGPQDNEDLVNQLGALRQQNDALSEKLLEATERGRQLEAEAGDLRAATHAAAEGAAAAVAAAATAQPQQPQRHPHQHVSGLPPLAPGAPEQPPRTLASRLLGAAGRVTSSGSLYGSHGESGQGDGELEDVARLRQQVSRLKASRDKLLLEIEKQWDEIERLSGENAGMADELRAARALATNWERQAQDGITQVEQLKDLLEDSAQWGAAGLAEQQAAQQQQLALQPGGLRHPQHLQQQQQAMMVAPTVQTLQVELLGEKARATELELQLRAVAAELLRCQHSSLDLGRSFLPMMAGVEKRLAQLCRKARSGT